MWDRKHDRQAFRAGVLEQRQPERVNEQGRQELGAHLNIHSLGLLTNSAIQIPNAWWPKSLQTTAFLAGSHASSPCGACGLTAEEGTRKVPARAPRFLFAARGKPQLPPDLPRTTGAVGPGLIVPLDFGGCLGESWPPSIPGGFASPPGRAGVSVVHCSREHQLRPMNPGDTRMLRRIA